MSQSEKEEPELTRLDAFSRNIERLTPILIKLCLVFGGIIITVFSVLFMGAEVFNELIGVPIVIIGIVLIILGLRQPSVSSSTIKLPTSDPRKPEKNEKIYNPLNRFVTDSLTILKRNHFACGRRNNTLGDRLLNKTYSLERELIWAQIDPKLKKLVEKLPASFDTVSNSEKKLYHDIKQFFNTNWTVIDLLDKDLCSIVHPILHKDLNPSELLTFGNFLSNYPQLITKAEDPKKSWTELRQAIVKLPTYTKYMKLRKDWQSAIENIKTRLVELDKE